MISFLAWFATITLLLATVVRATGNWPFVDLILTAVGLSVWGYVAIIRKDTPLMLTNMVGAIIAIIGIIFWN